MAFPTSPSNNQVHKETNGKSYVWDSTLGVWARLADADEFIRSGQLAEDISKQSDVIKTKKYEAGTVIQVEVSRNDLAQTTGIGSGQTKWYVPSGGPHVNIVPKADNSLFLYQFRSYCILDGHPSFSLAVSDDNGTKWRHNAGNRRGLAANGSGGHGTPYGYGEWFMWDAFNAEYTPAMSGFFYSRFKKGQANIRFGICTKNVWHPSGQAAFGFGAAEDGSATLIIQEVAQDEEPPGATNMRYQET